MNYIFYYISTLIPLVLLDALWILVLAKGFYAKHMGFLFTKSVSFVPVTIFYLLYAIGVVYFVVMPALSSNSWLTALFNGLFLGLLAYAAYDLTNQATIPNWPTVMTIVDICWGAFVTAMTGVIAYFLISFLR